MMLRRIGVTSLILLLGSLTFSSAAKDDLRQQWKDFKKTFNKVYQSVEEESQGLDIWMQKIAFVNRHNEEGWHSFTLDINEYSDTRFRGGDTYYRVSKRASDKIDLDLNEYNSSLPNSVDWRRQGCVGPVKNQGQLGDSGAFVAVDSIEGALCLKTGKLTALSFQNVIDCCNRTSLIGFYFGCLSREGGIDTAAFYPTTGKPGKCRFSKVGIGATLTGYQDISRGNETALQDAVAKIGPVVVAVDASHISFELYRSGVYNEKSCSRTSVDHVMLIVGYGTTESGLDYWIVKNSWGTSWGMDGYILMSRNKNNQCGIASDAVYPTGVSD